MARVEQTADEHIKMLARELAEASIPIWHWGDGQGGYIASVIENAMIDQGLGQIKLQFQQKLYTGSEKTVFERDGFRCQICGDWHDLTIDHIYPKSLGGTTELNNLQTLCRKCNSRKGNNID